MKRVPAQEFRRLDGDARTQCGALCWRLDKGKLRILLVTSRDTGRWVIPKGWPVPGLDEAASAAREAWEEAGVTGEVAAEPLGSFAYDKVLDRDQPVPAALPCTVAVYPLEVRDTARRFPEAKERRQQWFSPGKAAGKVDEPGLRLLIAGFAAGFGTG